MEVEIKLRLPDAAAHRRLSSFLAPRLLRTDAPARPLAAATAAQRDVRLYGTDDRDPSRTVLTLKRRPRIDAGVSRVEEVMEPLDPALALTCVDNPARLGAVDSPIVRLVSDEYGVGGDKAPFVCLGGFRNTRDFGTNYELECETAEPDQAKEVLERLLTFACFMAGKLLP
ncbi:hypothetical protein VPH35_119442 [Triticum aestivum]